jgi:hypothetical protein
MNGLPLVFGSAALLAAASARRGSRGRSRVGDDVWVLIKEWPNGGDVPGVSLHISERHAEEALIKDWAQGEMEIHQALEWDELHTHEQKMTFIQSTDGEIVEEVLGYYPTILEKQVTGPHSIRNLVRDKK